MSSASASPADGANAAHHRWPALDGLRGLAVLAVVALAADPDAMRFTGRTMDVAVLAREYGFTDLDGTQPDLNAGRFRD